MSTTIANFKVRVAAIMNRDATLFVVGGVDNILQAMNDARRKAQRDYNFELLRTEDAYLSCHLGGTNWMTAAKTTPGGSTAVMMKQLDEVWAYGTSTVGATTYYPRTMRIPFSYSGRFKRDLPYAQQNLYPITNNPNVFNINQFAYAVADQLFVTTISTATIYKLVGIKWSDDLTGSESSDMFLTYFTDWLTYATVAALNFYVKDTDKFQIDAVVMNSMWEAVKQMDGTIANMGESANLD